MLEIGRMRFSVFAYITEENERVIQALKNCLPPHFHKKRFDKEGTQNQFGDPLIIYSFETEDDDEIISILKHVSKSLNKKSKDYLERNLPKKINFEDRIIYIRFDKFQAYRGDIMITEGSDVIRVEISYIAYTQSQNSMEQIHQTLVSHQIIEE